jgi:hypothetical protein
VIPDPTNFVESTIPLSLRTSLYLDSQTTTSDDETDDDSDIRKHKVDVTIKGTIFFFNFLKDFRSYRFENQNCRARRR